MASIQIGYDVETGSVADAAARSGGQEWVAEALTANTAAKALKVIRDIHTSLDVPATIFICGKTLLHCVEELRSLPKDLFEIQQHTYSHVLFKDFDILDHYEPSDGSSLRIPAVTPETIREEVFFTNRLIERYLNRRCVGIRTPFGFPDGLKGNEDILRVLHENDMEYVSSVTRYEQGETSDLFQPFTYSSEGYADLVEIPFSWSDAVWFFNKGWQTGEGYKRILMETVDTIKEKSWVFSTCFHDLCVMKADEPGTRWIRDFIRYGQQEGLDFLSYGDYAKSFRE